MMASDVVRDLADDVMGTSSSAPANDTLATQGSVDTRGTSSQSQLIDVESYVWAPNASEMSGNVDRWMNGEPAGPRAPPNPRQHSRWSSFVPSQGTSQSVDLTGFWYVVAMLLPLFSLTGCRQWRCSPSTVLNSVELLLTQVSGYCRRARSRLRRMADEQEVTDVFAGAMDVILVVYAIGFLMLSLYQASIFHQF